MIDRKRRSNLTITTVLGILASCCSASNVHTIHKEPSFHDIMENKKSKPIQIKDFKANSTAGRGLLAAASRSISDSDSAIATDTDNGRGLEDSSYGSFLGDYAIKFQDCHSVTNWNANADVYSDYSTPRILQQNLVRFRLCPVGNCQHYGSTGCSSKYGDYVVDIKTFLYYYLSAQNDANSDIQSFCKNECQGDNNCLENCYYDYGYFPIQDSNGDDDGLANFDPSDYAQCAVFDNFYLGPYCADDGQSIYLALFSEDTCSQFSSCDVSCFYSAYGFALPYAATSLVSKNCLSCTYGTFQNDNGNGNSPREECQNIYKDTGKCESKMYIDYPNEAACTFVDGLKHLKNGASRGYVKRSKEAGIGIGFLTFSSLLLAVYVNYLYNKLSTAKFHLNSDAFA